MSVHGRGGNKKFCVGGSNVELLMFLVHVYTRYPFVPCMP